MGLNKLPLWREFGFNDCHMNNFVFQSPTKVCFGEQLSATSYEMVKELGAQRPLVITDDFIYKSGMLNAILEDIESSGIKVVVFSDVPPDSDLDCISRAVQLGRDNNCDSVIAVGGGSVMDTCKAVNICLSLGGDLIDYQGLNVISTKLFPMVAVPTTAGTGSEVSFVAMIKDNAEHRKLLFGSRFLAPDAAILDPTLLISLPPKLTAATGLDALTHALECLVASITNSPFTDALSLRALRLIFDYLPRATKNGEDMEARGATLVASTMAGCAFTNAGVGIIHALAHATGAKFKTHHGMTNAVYLPHGMRFNLGTSAPTYAQIARRLGFSDDLDDNKASGALIDAVENLLVEVNLPRDLKTLGVPKMDEPDFTDWANMVMEDPAIMFNPTEASLDDVKILFERAY